MCDGFHGRRYAYTGYRDRGRPLRVLWAFVMLALVLVALPVVVTGVLGGGAYLVVKVAEVVHG